MTEVMKYTIRRKEDLFEAYEVSFQKGENNNSSFNWRIFGNINLVLGSIMELYNPNRDTPDGPRQLRISLEGELREDKELIEILKRVENMANHKNGKK